MNGGSGPHSMPAPSQPSGPPPSAFVRQPAPTPYGYTQNAAPQQQQPYGHYGDLSVPPPPHSLAPVAMHSSTHSGSYNANLTGQSRAQTVVIREKPSLKWGIMIAMSGALLGGVLGLGMDARNKQGRAAAAAEALENAAPVTMTAAAQAPAPLAAPIAPPVAAPPVLAPRAPVAQAPVVLPSSDGRDRAGVVVPPVKAVAASHKTVTHHAAAHAAPAPVKARQVAAAEPEEKAEKPVKAAKPEPAEKKPARDAQTAAAQALLEQANKDTSSTLSGGR